ncbi:hypothetical protein ES708_24010 [subsurface metagenome]
MVLRYYIYRAAFSFDTSGLDDNMVITNAYLTMRATVNSTLSQSIILKNGMPTYPHIPIETGDYKLSHYSGNGGIADFTGVETNDIVTLTLNSSGRSWINKTGYSKFILVSANDNNRVAPTGPELAYIQIYYTPLPSTDLKLTVEYFISTGIPSVGDPTFSNTKANYTTATANVSDDGGGYLERGFEYGTSKDAMWATRETGAFTGTGNFSMQISGLVPGEIYYVRAYVMNIYGTDYSEWTSFTTTDVPQYGIYEESNSLPDSDGIYANSNTICFYVRKVGGKWSIKHGPYTSDQIDIEITKILIEGKGKYQIKFESDVLTGLSASVMCKLDIKAR